MARHPAASNQSCCQDRLDRGRGESETARSATSHKTVPCLASKNPPPSPPTVAEILGRYWRASEATTAEEELINRIMTRIPRCRTGRLGGAAFNCTQCDHATLTMRSCGNRHCPTCNALKRRQWRDRLIGWSLDCDYLHVVFTLPHEFNGVIAAHQKILYDLHFRCVSAVLNQTAEKEYGCEIGIVEVLHTWGQRLGSHVHIHNVMTAGGLSHDKKQWIPISAADAGLKAAKRRKAVAWDVSPRIAEQWAWKSQRDDRSSEGSVDGNNRLRLGNLLRLVNRLLVASAACIDTPGCD